MKSSKTLLSKKITLFSEYETIKLKDENFINNYKDYVMPTYFEWVAFNFTKASNVSKTGNTSLGSHKLTLNLNAPTKVYRIINNVKYYLEYIDNVLYALKKYDEQEKKYFTLKAGLSFIADVKQSTDMYKIPFNDISDKSLRKKGISKYTIKIVDANNNVISCTGDI